jgi:hypothetical protein
MLGALGLVLLLGFGCRRTPRAVGLESTDAGSDAGVIAIAEPPPSGTFGLVRDAVTGEPLTGVSVRFLMIDPGAEALEPGQRSLAVATGSNPPGQYTYEGGFPEGLVRVEIEANGYEPYTAYRNHWYSEECARGGCSRLDFDLWRVGVHHEVLPDLVPNPSFVHPVTTGPTHDCDGEPGVCVRFSVGTGNMSTGALLLTATGTDPLLVTQRVFGSDGMSFRDVPLEDSFEPVGVNSLLRFTNTTRVLLRPVRHGCDTIGTADRCDPVREWQGESLCLESSTLADDGFRPEHIYGCTTYPDGRVEQGIGAGFMDLDDSGYRGQYLDITGLDAGEYWLETQINQGRVLQEADYANNVVRARHRIDRPECGNGIVEAPEDCDGDEVRIQGCQLHGELYTEGDVTCGAECGYDYSGCTRAVCEPIDVGSNVGALIEGNLNLARDTTEPRYCHVPQGTGKDAAFLWTAPASGTYNVQDVLGALFVYVREGSCDGEELACATVDAAFGVDFQAEEGQPYVFVLDALPGLIGRYELQVTGPL